MLKKTFLSIMLTISIVISSFMPALGVETEAGEGTETSVSVDEETTAYETEPLDDEAENVYSSTDEELTVEAEADKEQNEAVAASAEAEEDTEEDDEIPDIDLVAESYQPSNDTSCEDLFEGYVNDAFGISNISSGKLKASRATAASKLSDPDRMIYDYIAGELPRIASGEQVSTIFTLTEDNLGGQLLWTAQELGVDAIVVDGAVPTEVQKAVVAKINLSQVVDALLNDFPYHLYWFDKTVGVMPALTLTVKKINGEVVCGFKETCTLSFAVAGEFSSGADYEVDPNVGLSVQSAVENAESIVSKYSGEEDFDIICAYRDEICDLTSYNETATGGGLSYGNPWQLVWVFDGDPDTEVVCEGYAKAFKYLCDQTSFAADIGCISVTGYLNGSGHMWNIVNMDDDVNYLADLTNYDLGYDLFLTGASGSVDAGYTAAGNTYVYDSDMLGLWDTEELTLIVHGYNEHEYGDWEVAVSPTCTEEGSREKTCQLCGHKITEPVSATGHVWEEEYTVDIEPTYTEEGAESIHCSVCGESKEGTSRSIPVLESGWMEDENGWKYLRTDGTYLVSQFEVIDGRTYYFDESEYRVTGLQEIEGEKYYFDESGVMLTGWQTIDGDQYYFEKSGKMHYGWLKYGGEWYFLRVTGVMHTGWLKKGGIYYFFRQNGTRLSGWLKKNGLMYYFKVNGARHTGWLKKSGKYYYFKTTGPMHTGWLKLSGNYYYFKENGQMVTGNYKIGSNWYTFNSSGVRQ